MSSKEDVGRLEIAMPAMQNLEALKKMSADDLGVSLGQFRRNLLLEIAKLKMLHGKEDGRIALKPLKKNVQIYLGAIHCSVF